MKSAILNLGIAVTAVCSAGCRDGIAPQGRELNQPAATSDDTGAAIIAERSELDATVFAGETEAQRHETTIVKFWDELRLGDAFAVLKRLPLKTIKIGTPTPTAGTDWGLPGLRAAELQQPGRELNHEEYVSLLTDLEEQGWQVEQSEWHHSQFEPATGTTPAQSIVGFEIHAVHGGATHRVVVRGDLNIEWSGDDDAAGDPVAKEIKTGHVQLVGRNGPIVFHERLTVDPLGDAPSRIPRVSPILLHDLDGDGLPEVILGGCNLVYWNHGDFQFEKSDFLTHEIRRPAEAGILADFTGDGVVDYVTASLDREGLLLFAGATDGHFRDPPRVCLPIAFQNLHALTAGDIDGDGDLDLFAGQWKAPYVDGTMPTPFYDAKDGHPDYLLVNDGSGYFTDETSTAGLAGNRNRRTFSASFIDLDDDLDLDLVVVADFSGLDVYLNENGRFRDSTSEMVSDRHGFGMSHAFGDFDNDGRTDLYMVGMSSTTARRLDGLGAARPQRDDYTRMRAPMAFGNRLLLNKGGRFVQSENAGSAARTGWSWGCAAPRDFDLDGDTDIYVANGHLSGSSAKDYCTKFWCHDLYTGASQPNAEIDQFFKENLGMKLGREFSWNGFEHNALLLNEPGEQFYNGAFHFGVACEYDSRAVATGDLDADGRPDLAVVEYRTDTMSQRLHVLRNRLEADRNWIGVRFRSAPGSGGSPIGATVTFKSGDKTWVRQVVSGESFTAQHERIALIGLGEVDTVDLAEIRWQTGEVTCIENPPINQYQWAKPPN